MQRLMNQRRRKCMAHYACSGRYSELKDVNEEREARAGAEKAKE